MAAKNVVGGGAGVMAVYRVYYVGKDGHFFGVESIEAEDAAAIIARTEELCAREPRCVGIEIWDRQRLVHKHTGEA